MRLHVDGMTCAHCERAIETAVAARGGRAHVDRAGGIVEVDGALDEAAVRRAIEAEGYRVAATPAADAPDAACCGGGCHG